MGDDCTSGKNRVLTDAELRRIAESGYYRDIRAALEAAIQCSPFVDHLDRVLRYAYDSTDNREPFIALNARETDALVGKAAQGAITDPEYWVRFSIWLGIYIALNGGPFAGTEEA